MRSNLSALWLVAIAGAMGCAERATLISNPPGAKMYVNDKLIGTAPTVLSVPRANFHPPFRFRAELDGYRTEEGEVRTQVLPGRVTGMIFTLGILALFKQPTGFMDPLEVTLRPDPTSFVGSRPPSPSLSIEERLERARKLRDSGAITDQEYELRKQDILRDF